MRKIAFQNLKGGTGKTTSAVTLASLLSSRGHRVLLVDMDAQGNVKEHFGLSHPYTMYDLLLEEAPVEACLVVARDGLDCLISDATLAACETILVSRPRREEALARSLQDLEGYDFVLVDCPPSLSILNQNALVFAEELIIPVSMDFLALIGAAQVMEHLALIERYFAKRLRLLGVLPTFFDRRTRISHDVYQALQARYGERVWPPIRIDTKIPRAPSARLTIDTYRRTSRGAQDYEAVCDLLIRSGQPAAEASV
ncbi:MAG: ParA family protein [Candidatus Tectimicrobiota bacterium]